MLGVDKKQCAQTEHAAVTMESNRTKEIHNG